MLVLDGGEVRNVLNLSKLRHNKMSPGSGQAIESSPGTVKEGGRELGTCLVSEELPLLLVNQLDRFPSRCQAV